MLIAIPSHTYQSVYSKGEEMRLKKKKALGCSQELGESGGAGLRAGPWLITVPPLGSFDLAISFPALLVLGPDTSSWISVTTRTEREARLQGLLPDFSPGNSRVQGVLSQ